MSIAAALDLPKGGILSLVGAGGKTTLLYRLAAELVAQGRRVVCATTTRILAPTPTQAPLMLEADLDRLLARCRQTLAQTGLVCAAQERDGADKLVGLSAETIHRLWSAKLCDWLLLEADGARCLPLKAPADHEPVIPDQSGHVLAVVGLTAVGQPLDEEHVCRSRQFAAVSGLALGALVTPQAIAAACLHPQGLFKGTPAGARRCLWLNQADTPETQAAGQDILALLAASTTPPHRIVLGAARQARPVLEVWPS